MTVSFETSVPASTLKTLPVTNTLPANKFLVIVRSPVIVPPLFASTELFALTNAEFAYEAVAFCASYEELACVNAELVFINAALACIKAELA